MVPQYKIILFSALTYIISITPQVLCWQSAKVNPELRLALDIENYPFAFRKNITLLQKSDGSQTHKILTKFDGDRSELHELGLKVSAQIGSIYALEGTTAQIKLLLDLPGLQFAEGERYFQNQNDIAVELIMADMATQQFGLTGRGVLVGIIDTGIDWEHEDFRNSDGTTRIKYLLDLSSLSKASATAGTTARGGTVYTESQINRALLGNTHINSNDFVGHGSHVAGIAAGNGMGTGGSIPSGKYAGVAPEADLIIVKATSTTGTNYDLNDLVTSLAFIDSIATLLGQPYVANLSIGSQSGAHDGTNLEELAIDELVGTGKPGKAVVVSAGNDRETQIHVSETFSPTEDTHRISFEIPEYTAQDGTQNDYVLFEVWYPGSATMNVSINTPKNHTYGPVYANEYWGDATQEGTIYIENAEGGANSLNGDKQMLIQLYDYNADTPPAKGSWEIIIKGIYGTYDLWMNGNTINAQISSQTTISNLISTPGTAQNAITVGSFVSKKRWENYYGNIVGYDITISELSSYSSPGPTRDGRLKPEISAPGQEIASTFSSAAEPGSAASVFTPAYDEPDKVFILRDNKHGILHGTSMAAPFVTGAVALLLERNPQLDAAQIKEILTSSARSDSYTGSVPNYDFGFGKLDVLSAINQIEETLKYPAPYQLKVSENSSGIQLSWQAPYQNEAANLSKISFNRVFHKDEIVLEKRSNNPIPAADTYENSNADLVSYQLYRSQDAFDNFSLITDNFLEQSFTDTAVTLGQKYWYYVTAIYQNPDGESQPSNKVYITRGSETNFPLEIIYDNATPEAYGFLPEGHIAALKFDLDQDFDEYYLNSVKFFYVNYQTTNTTDKTRIRIRFFNTLSSGAIGQEFAQTKVYTKMRDELQPNWTEIDLRHMEIFRKRNEALIIGIEWVSGDSSTIIFDNSTDIPQNQAFYYATSRWEEHYDFWQDANLLGYPMIRAVFTSQPVAYPEPIDYETLYLEQNYPNPFNSNTTFSFYSPEVQNVTLEIFDLLGRKVTTIYENTYDNPDEKVRVIWNGQSDDGTILPSGVYFARLKAGENTSLRKIVLVR